jgi:hypothetical protein
MAEPIPSELAIRMCKSDRLVYIVTTENHRPALHIEGYKDNKTVGGSYPIPKK